MTVIICRCQISSGVRSPRDKNQNGQEEDEEENGEKTFITEVLLEPQFVFIWTR